MSHTPGPWKLEIEDRYTFRILAADGTDLLGNIEDRWYPNVPESRDDQRLIAAAPDLLEALKEIVRGDQP
jgi:hypothetical protein